MHPVVLVVTLLAAIAVLMLPRRQALTAILIVAFLTPSGEQLLFSGFHFFSLRIILLAGLGRFLRNGCTSVNRIFSGGLLAVDKLFLAWAICHATAFVLLFRTAGAAAYEIAFLLDTCVGYSLLRYLIQDYDDFMAATKSLVYIACILALSMAYEHFTRVNAFNYIRIGQVPSWLRDGKVRAQGPFAISITAGTFGATVLPIFFWLWRSKKLSLLGLFGLTAGAIISLSSVASTAFTAFAAAILGLAMWPIRNYTRHIRWGLLFTLVLLAVLMRAPVWFIIARIDFVGGHGWDRAFLIDSAVRHFWEWWLVGTNANATWGGDAWDTCNQFIFEATSGGLLSCILFIAILVRSFGMVGRARRHAAGNKKEWLFWCLGVALLAHVIAFWGVDYFDTIRFWWYIFLAMIPAALSYTSEPAKRIAPMRSRLEEVCAGTFSRPIKAAYGWRCNR
jgi:hypothetical protein